MRNLLIPLVILVWIILGWKMCNDYTACCGEEIAVVAETPPPVLVTDTDQADETPKSCPEMVCFDKSDCNPIFSDSWVSYRDSIVNAIGTNQKLVITGYSNPSETNNSTFENLGLCRADTIRRALLPYLESKATEIAGQLRVGQGSSIEGYSGERISFKIISEGADVNSSTLIYFPFNSTDKLADSSVETYLKQVAVQVKSSGQRVRLTGHTDSLGNDAYNMNLGRQRANIIKNYLMEQGVPSSQIIAQSKGESQPIVSNATEQGRAKNRRTELQIIN